MSKSDRVQDGGTVMHCPSILSGSFSHQVCSLWLFIFIEEVSNFRIYVLGIILEYIYLTIFKHFLCIDSQKKLSMSWLWWYMKLKMKNLLAVSWKKVGGDLTACCLTWEFIHYFLQHHTVTVDIRRTTIKQENIPELLPLLDRLKLTR